MSPPPHGGSTQTKTLKLLFPKQHLLTTPTPTLKWLITSPFHSPHTIISTLHSLSSSIPSESSSLRSLLIRGFHVTGAVIHNPNESESDHGMVREVMGAVRELREELYQGQFGEVEIIGGVVRKKGGEVRFFCEGQNGDLVEFENVVFDEDEGSGKRFVWENGCLLRCQLGIKLSFYFNPNDEKDAIARYECANEALATMLKDPQMTYILEVSKKSSNLPQPIVIRGSQLDFQSDSLSVKDLSENSQTRDEKSLCCSHFCSDRNGTSSIFDAESADTIQVTALLNKSEKSLQSTAPVAEYCPASQETELRIIDYKLEVLCYGIKSLPLPVAISKLIIPALVDQLTTIKNAILPCLFVQHPQLRPYHYCPPGILHPITVLYELSYGETELKQVDARRSLHLRLGLPCDRPLLRVANALNFEKSTDMVSGKRGYALLKDVHVNIPSSGVSGGLVSLVQGSYEYHHYLQNGFDDSGWGCAYRSLQTIISWFRLQHYTSIEVPTHREIQQALVEIEDKDPSFIGSREWIGAIELSYVLDKLLGVTCKVLNVRSGAELPEKCRELALHFEQQGTPIMIGGGVLAYTLLGVDYNDASGDCAFLILDPHYTSGEDLKKIVNGGWCGWKKAVDSKGKNFFLHDKFYNLLLPQRPNMV